MADDGNGYYYASRGSGRMQLISRGLDPSSFRLQRRPPLIRIRYSPEPVTSSPDSDSLKRKRDEDEDKDADQLASNKRPKHDPQGPSVRVPFTHYDTLERETTSEESPASRPACPASCAASSAASLPSTSRHSLNNSTGSSNPRRRSGRIWSQPT